MKEKFYSSSWQKNIIHKTWLQSKAFQLYSLQLSCHAVEKKRRS